MQISDCYSRRAARKAHVAKHHHHLTLVVLQLKEMKKICGKGERRKIRAEDQTSLNENVWETQQIEKRIGSKIGKPFPCMSLKPQTLAQICQSRVEEFGGATTLHCSAPQGAKGCAQHTQLPSAGELQALHGEAN